MKNIDIETFYKKIDKRIKLATAFSGLQVLPKIIRSCRLKPISMFNKKFQFTKGLERCWFDEFGNSIYLERNNIKIILGNLKIPYTSCTDLFYGNAIKTILTNSKFALVAEGKDQISNNDIAIISFYGLDEYARTFIFDTDWHRVSPLMIGSKMLCDYFDNINKNLIEFDMNDCIIEYKIDKCVAGSLPFSKDILNEFKNKEIRSLI